MDLTNIATFICTAKLGSFTRAAEELKYAQSTVTAQIQHLERELGFPLFERIGRINHLTAGGKAFLGYATEMMRLFQKSTEIGEELKQARGVLRIGVLESLLFANLLPVISELRRDFPNLEIVIKMGQAYELEAMLKRNQLDIIYISHALNTDSTIKCHYQRREELVFVTVSGHPLTASGVTPIQAVFAHPFITTESTGYCYGRLREIASKYNLVLQHNITVDSITAIVSLLGENGGIAFLPEYAIREQLHSGALVKIVTDLPPQYYYSQLLCHREKWTSSFVEGVIELIKRHYPGN